MLIISCVDARTLRNNMSNNKENVQDWLCGVLSKWKNFRLIPSISVFEWLSTQKSVIDVVKGGVAWECERVSNQELFTLNLNVQFYTSYFFWKRWIKKNQPNISTVLKQHNDYDYWCVNDNSLESFILFTILCFILFQLFSHSFSFALSFFFCYSLRCFNVSFSSGFQNYLNFDFFFLWKHFENWTTKQPKNQ